MTTTTQTTQTATTATKATKATKVTLEQVKQLVEVRAEIARLEKMKVALTEQIEGSFEIDKKNKTSRFTTLTHNAIDFARLDWRSRKGIDSEKLALEFPEAFEACQKPVVYSVIVSLFK